MSTIAFLLMVIGVIVWWQWQYGLGWTIRTIRRVRKP
jgi:hypothetical protein